MFFHFLSFKNCAANIINISDNRKLNISNLHFFVNVGDVLFHLLVCLAEVAYGAACVEDGRVVLVSAVCADDGEGQMRVFFCEEHADLAHLDNLALAGFGVDGLDRNAEVVAHDFLDILDGDLLGGGFDVFVHHFAGEVEGDVAVVAHKGVALLQACARMAIMAPSSSRVLAVMRNAR